VTAIVPFGNKPPTLPRPMLRQVKRGQARMMRTAEISMAAMDEISDVFAQGHYRTVATLSEMALLRQAAELQGTLTPADRLRLDELREAYHDCMGFSAKLAAQHILEIADLVAQDRRTANAPRGLFTG